MENKSDEEQIRELEDAGIKLPPIDELEVYVNAFEKLADGIETFAEISETELAEPFFEVMGIMARDRDYEPREIIQFIDWTDFGMLVRGEANAARAQLMRMKEESPE